MGRAGAGLLRIWERWKRIAHAIGNVQARILLSVLYFILVGPFALPVRLLMDPLALRRPSGTTFWLARRPRTVGLDEARKQS